MATATLSFRGTCPICGRSYRLRADGNMCRHPLNEAAKNISCPGEGRKPKRGTKKQVVVAGEAWKAPAAPPKLKGPPTIKASQMTHVAVVLDNSYSMNPLRDGAIAAFNSICEPIRNQSNDYAASYYKFCGTVDTMWRNRSPRDIPLLDRSTYRADGNWTALYDAMGLAIQGLKSSPDANEATTAFLLVVVTDGEENRSGSYDASRLRDLIQHVQATDRWTIAISCPRGGYAERMANKLGIPIGNFQEWDQTDKGIEVMGTTTRDSTLTYCAQRTSGKTNTTTFYRDINIGRQAVGRIENKLPLCEPSARFRKLTSTKACEIRELVEQKKLLFAPGCAYYALIKKEKIQAYKQLVLERRDTGARYAGPQVRTALGMPKNQDGTINPGNLGEWIVWVQSTSVNRKLLAKMDVLYDKNS